MNNFEDLKQQITAEVLSGIKNMLASMSSEHQTNDTYADERSDNMASKYKQRVKIGEDSAGRAIYQFAYGNTQDELNQRIAELIMPRISSKTPAERPDCPLWEDYCKNWFEVFKLPTIRDKTKHAERGRMYKHVIPAFEGMRVDDITTTDVMKVLNLKSHYKHSYLRDIMSLMKQVFMAAVDDELIKRNPMSSSRVKNPSQEKSEERKPLTAEEQIDIISNISKIHDLSDRRFMAFLMFTPMRPSEIYGLRWEDIDFKNGFIHISRALTFAKGRGILDDTKTQKSTRTIPLDSRLSKFLQPISNEGVIICRNYRGHQGEYHTEQSARRSWERIKKDIDVHGMTPYIGRHTFATNMSKAGVPMKTAMTIMGHTDERMLIRHYVHTDNDDLRTAGKLMNSYVDVQDAKG